MAGTRTKKITGVGVRDDKPKRRKNKPSQSQVPVRFWFSVGVAVSVLTFMLSGTSNTAEPDIAGSEVYRVEERKEPVFDFYTVLPEAEVIVADEPDPSLSVPLRPAPKPAAVKQETIPETVAAEREPASTVQYLLQVGSFRETKDADRLRGRLLLNGFEPYIQSVIVNGNEWYRVQLGPFSEKEQAGEVRVNLTELGIDSIIRQQK